MIRRASNWLGEREALKTLQVIFFLQYDPMHKQSLFYLLLFCFQTMITILSESGWRQLGDFLDRLKHEAVTPGCNPATLLSFTAVFISFSSNSSGSKHTTNKLNRLAKTVSGETKHLGLIKFRSSFFFFTTIFFPWKVRPRWLHYHSKCSCDHQTRFPKKTLPSSVLCSFSLSKH